jgi:glycosyltransferase involved in cell wall biosynthesis
MSKLAVDLTYQPVGGALAQINEVIKSVESYSFNKVVFYLSKENRHLFDKCDSKKVVLKFVPFSNTSIVFRTLWVQLLMPFLLMITRVDVLFCPGNISPIFSFVKKTQWIGTVGPFEPNFISSFGLKQKIVLFVSKYLIILSSKTSDLVIFESNYTRNLFVEKYGQSKDKAAVLYIGNDEYFYPVTTQESIISANYNRREFLLTVSHLYPYKNIELLIESFNQLSLKQRGLYLLIAGSIIDEPYYEKLKGLLESYGISEHVVFLGRLERSELKELYSQCKAFVFTSPFENFAYTLVEAMSCGAPIIATNTTAMPETCGEAALYFSPNKEEELSSCISRFLDDEKLRILYKEKALMRAEKFDVYSVVNQKTNKLLEGLVDKS